MQFLRLGVMHKHIPQCEFRASILMQQMLQHREDRCRTLCPNVLAVHTKNERIININVVPLYARVTDHKISNYIQQKLGSFAT